jgi:chromosome segregation ATPase
MAPQTTKEKSEKAQAVRVNFATVGKHLSELGKRSKQKDVARWFAAHGGMVQSVDKRIVAAAMAQDKARAQPKQTIPPRKPKATSTFANNLGGMKRSSNSTEGPKKKAKRAPVAVYNADDDDTCSSEDSDAESNRCNREVAAMRHEIKRLQESEKTLKSENKALMSGSKVLKENEEAWKEKEEGLKEVVADCKEKIKALKSVATAFF